MLNAHLAIIGGGSWGTAFAKVCALAGYEVAFFVRDPVMIDEINLRHKNPAYLPGITLPDTIQAYPFDSTDPTGFSGRKWDQYELLFIGVPTQSVRHCLSYLGEIPPHMPVISLAKGIERGTALRVSEVIREFYPHCAPGVLSGPNLAAEVAANMPTTAVLAIQEFMHNAPQIQAFVDKIQCTHFSIQCSQDIIGVEIAGAMKNIIALACGMAAGLGFGENTLASLITQGFQEISRFILALGGGQGTLLSPAGIGDLTVTCYAKSSRNHSFGMEMARKYLSHTLPVLPGEVRRSDITGNVGTDALSFDHPATVITHGTEQVVEAIPTLNALGLLAEKHHITAPFVQIMQAIIAHSLPLDEGIRQLVALPCGL